MSSCSISGCIADKAYAIIKNNKIHRISFSKSLCNFIVGRLDQSYKVISIKFGLGEKIEPG